MALAIDTDLHNAAINLDEAATSIVALVNGLLPGTPTFDTAQNLRDQVIPAADVPSVALTLGALSNGDGGAGLWRWDASSELSDNLGTVLLPTGWTGPGRWIRQFNGPVNVRWFGGIAGYGSGADIGAILQTIHDTYLVPNGGGAIQIPFGVWEWKTSCVMTQSGVSIFGDTRHGFMNRADAQGTVLRLAGSLGTEPMLSFKIASGIGPISSIVGIRLERLFFVDQDSDGNYRNCDCLAALELDGLVQARLSDVRMDGIVGSGLRIGRLVQAEIDALHMMRCGTATNPALHFFLTASDTDNYTQSVSFTDTSLEVCYGDYSIKTENGAARSVTQIFFNSLRMENAKKDTPDTTKGYIYLGSGVDNFIINSATMSGNWTTDTSNLPNIHIDGASQVILNNVQMAGKYDSQATQLLIENSTDIQINTTTIESYNPNTDALPYGTIIRNSKHTQFSGCRLIGFGLSIESDYCLVDQVLIIAHRNLGQSFVNISGDGNQLTGLVISAGSASKTYTEPVVNVVGNYNIISNPVFPVYVNNIAPALIRLSGDNNNIDGMKMLGGWIAAGVEIISGFFNTISNCNFYVGLTSGIRINPTITTGEAAYPNAMIVGNSFGFFTTANAIVYEQTAAPTTTLNSRRPLIIANNERTGPSGEKFLKMSACSDDATLLSVPVVLTGNYAPIGIDVPLGLTALGQQISYDKSFPYQIGPYTGMGVFPRRETHADNAAAVAAGLELFEVYVTPTGEMRIVVP